MDNLCHQVFALSFKEPGAIEFFADNLPEKIVFREGKGYGEFYRALLEFYKKTGVDVVDRVAFRAWAKEDAAQVVEALGGEEGLNAYVDEVLKVEMSDPKSVTALMHYWNNKSEQREKAGKLAEMLEEESLDRTDQIDNLVRQIGDLNRTGVDPLKSVYDGSMMAEKADSLWELPDFLPTPFKNLNVALGYDEEAGGICKGSVSAVLARSGHGKSTFSRTLALHWIETGNTVLYVNYEEATAHWERILFTQVTGFNIYRGSQISEDEKKKYTQKFKQKMEEWNGRLLAKHDPDTPYFEDLEAWLRDIHSKGKTPDAIFIDTIQSMFLKHGRSLPRWGQFEEMMVRLEKLAKDLHCAIIITAQENRNREKAGREVVQQSDAGGSLSIIQKSSVTIFITKAKLAVGDDALDEHIMQLQIPKNRITGAMSMMDPPLVMYDDKTKSYKDIDIPEESRTVDAEDFEIY